MNTLLQWLSGLELSTIHVVSIAIFAIYIILSTIGFAVTFAFGRGYLDLAKGLRRILERQEAAGQLDDVSELAGEIRKYYESYIKYNPSVCQRYPGIISWLDDILLQTNMFTDSKRKRKKFGVWFEEYYDTLVLVQKIYEKQEPFYRCSSSQSQLLEDLADLKNETNASAVDSLLKKAEEEFIRLNNDGKKNERINYISIAIGVAGILVSVLLTILQMFG